MKIPAVANRIRDIAELIRDDFPTESGELLELASELRRRSPNGPRAPATSTPMTPELAEEIKEFSQDNPEMSQQDIGVIFNVNHGRISEILKGNGNRRVYGNCANFKKRLDLTNDSKAKCA